MTAEPLIIKIYNKDYKVEPGIFMSALDLVAEKYGSDNHTYRDEVICFIFDGIDQSTKTDLSFEDVAKIEDSQIITYIRAFPISETIQEMIKTNAPLEDICKIFVTEQFNLPGIKTALAQFEKNIAYVKSINTTGLTTGLLVAAKTIENSVAHMLAESWTASVYAAGAVLSEMAEAAQINLANISRALFEFALSLPTSYSKEKKIALLHSYKQWGEYGWSIIPYNRELFDELPPDQKAADMKARKFFGKKQIDSFFAELQTLDGIKKKDVEEAISDYKNRCYKSSVMVILSLFDARVIRLQKSEDRDRRGYRKTGKQAGERIFARLGDEIDENYEFRLLLRHQNVMATFSKVFEGADDFKVQPKIVNRNFIDHGMQHRKVSRTDAIKVFLLYYNITSYLNYMKQEISEV